MAGSYHIMDQTLSNGETLQVGPYDTGIPLNDTTYRLLAGAGMFFNDANMGAHQLGAQLEG